RAALSPVPGGARASARRHLLPGRDLYCAVRSHPRARSAALEVTMRGRTQTLSILVSLVYWFGMVLVFLGERVVASGNARGTLTGLGLVAILGAIVWRLLRKRSGDADRGRVEGVFVGLYALGGLALLLYFAQSDLMTRLFSKPIDRILPRGQVVLAALWPA